MDEIRAELAELQEGFGPTADELEQDEPARRRDLETERQKKETAELQAALDDVLPEVFAAAREAMRRTLGMRHFDVQLMGAAVLHQGKIAEMKTGEGKTLVAPIAAILNGLTGRGVHVVTVERLPGPPRRPVDGPDLPLPRRLASGSWWATRRTSSSPATRRPTSG